MCGQGGVGGDDGIHLDGGGWGLGAGGWGCDLKEEDEANRYVDLHVSSVSSRCTQHVVRAVRRLSSTGAEARLLCR